VATAAACQQSGFESIGIVRGEKPRLLSSTLLEAAGYGMRLLFHNHELYRQRFIPPELTSEDTFVIDQGGYGLKGVEGATTILDYGPGNFSHICCAVGTGTMMAGLVRAVHPEQQVIGISAMKNNSALDDVIFHFNEGMERKWKIFHDYHFGGFAKHKPELIRFMNDFYEQTGLPSDFVYTGKLFYAINDLLRNDFFPAHSRILLIHSGGLQGNNSLQKGTLIF
jgi:1-aminocyclopropane-1-carboxylate deaminase